jgi:peptidoglycan/LPS O-acetylase OafA/YrhL
MTDQNPRDNIPALDGLRGMAILMVLFYHCQFNTELVLKDVFPVAGPVINKVFLSGFLGVDLFFALSGFLITRILIGTKSSPQYFMNFYARRFLRIFPLYYGVLFVIFFILPYFISFDQTTIELASRQWWLWAYLSNVPVSGEWNTKMFYFSHFWSLSVEEHFYIIWPAVVFLSDFKWLKRICIGVVVISFSSGIMSAIFNDRIIWLFSWSTISHIGGLALGSLCAIIYAEKGALDGMIPWAKRGFNLFGCFLLLGIFIPRQFNLQLVNHCLILISSLFFVSLLILVVTMPDRFGGRFFTNSVMTGFGKISYGLYVYHYILIPQIDFVFPIGKLVIWLNSPVLGIIAHTILVIGGTFLIAYCSWHLYEKQFLKLKKYFEYRAKAAQKKVPEIAMLQDKS